MAAKPGLTEIIDGKAVRTLAEGRAIHGATVLGQPGGWTVVVRYGTVERAVAAQRSTKPRLWRNLATAAAFVQGELGVARFEVDAKAHRPAARRRPDQAARMKQRHAAAEHDAWFREQVEIAMKEADDPKTVWIPHEEVMASLDERIERLKRLAD